MQTSYKSTIFVGITYVKIYKVVKKNLQYVSTSELKKALRSSKILTIIQAISVSIMSVFGILITIENGINPFTFLPFIFLPMVIMGFIQMKKFKKELERRNE